MKVITKQDAPRYLVKDVFNRRINLHLRLKLKQMKLPLWDNTMPNKNFSAWSPYAMGYVDK